MSKIENGPIVWPVYHRTKTVRAIQIKEVSETYPDPDNGDRIATITFVDDKYKPIEVHSSFIAANQPVALDYIVLNDNGSMRCVPPEIFEPNHTIA